MDVHNDIESAILLYLLKSKKCYWKNLLWMIKGIYYKAKIGDQNFKLLAQIL